MIKFKKYLQFFAILLYTIIYLCGKIIIGEEEFAFVKAYDWNVTGTKIAYIKFDETEVPEFSMDMYNEGLYPTQTVFKYPKAGEKNAIVSIHMSNSKT